MDKQMRIDIAVIDGQLNPITSQRFKIKKYPSFLYFHRGQPQNYFGSSDTFEDIHNWLYKRVHDSVKIVSTVGEVWDLQDQQEVIKLEQQKLQIQLQLFKVVIVYFGEINDKEFTKIYQLVAKRYDRAFFTRAENNSTELYKAYDITETPSVILLKKSSVEHVVFDRNWTHANFERWIVQKSLPDVFEFDQNNVFHIFAHKHIALFLFRDPRSKEHLKLEQRFREIAQDLKNDPRHEEIFFVTSDIGKPEQKKLGDFIGINYEHLPLMVLIHPNHGDQGLEKYILQEEDLHERLTYERLDNFLHHKNTGRLRRHLKSQDNVQNITASGTLYEIRGNQKLQEFIDWPNKDVVILYYGHCTHSQNIQFDFEEVADIMTLRPQNKLVFGRIDVIQNDLEVKVDDYPTIKFYKRGSKDQPIIYQGARQTNGIIQFLEHNPHIPEVYMKDNFNQKAKFRRASEL